MVLYILCENAAAQCFGIFDLDAGCAYPIYLHAALRAAVFLGDDGVLCNIKEAAREVARLRGAKRRVGESFARTMGTHEVLNGIQALNHGRDDRHFNGHAGGVLDEALHSGHLGKTRHVPTRARDDHVGNGANRVNFFRDLLLHFLLPPLPYFNGHAALFLFGEKAVLEIFLKGGDFRRRFSNDVRLFFRHRRVVNRPGNAGTSRVVKAETLHFVHDARHGIKAVAHDTVVYDAGEHFLRDGFVHERIVRGKHGVEEEAADGRLKRVILKSRVLLLTGDWKHLYLGAQVYRIVFRRENSRVRRSEMFAFAFRLLHRLREPVDAENDVHRLSDENGHIARARLKNVLVGAHNVRRLPLRFLRERHVHGHLVAVKVRVESVADKRMQLDGVALNKSRTE